LNGSSNGIAPGVDADRSSTLEMRTARRAPTCGSFDWRLAVHRTLTSRSRPVTESRLSGNEPTAVNGEGSVHLVQVGTDSSVFVADAPSDTRHRHELYAAMLVSKRPGSWLTTVVLGAPHGLTTITGECTSFVPVPGNRVTTLLRLPTTLRGINRRRRIDLITTQTIFEDAQLALAFGRSRDIPVVGQVHFDVFADASLGGDRLRRAYHRVRRWRGLRRLHRLAAVRVVGSEVAAKLRAGGWHDRIVVAPVPSTLLERRRTPASGARVPLVLFVGRLAPEKNLGMWLDVASRVRNAFPAATFAIVGGGELQTMVAREVVSRSLEEVVRLIGAVPNEHLADWYEAASVLLVTSRHEGFGRVVIEALAHEVAVVVPDLGGIPDIVRDGYSGVLYPPGDVEAAAGAVTMLLRDRSKRDALARTGYQVVLGQYSPGALAEAWMDFLLSQVIE
jgi:glycosyltransferase involved in cell wall biosynthesis